MTDQADMEGPDVQQGGQDPSDGAVTVEEQAAPPITQQLPPFKVLLHNDDVNDFEHVIGAVMRLTPLGMEDAILRTIEAHESGVALLLVTHQERAELYCEQFASCSLTVTTEPDA